jgi:hypothetical protein
MPRLRLRSKLLILLIAGLSSVGMNVGSRFAKAVSCAYCVSIYDQSGRLVGYGCASGARSGVCSAGVNYCSINYTQQCS